MSKKKNKKNIKKNDFKKQVIINYCVFCFLPMLLALFDLFGGGKGDIAQFLFSYNMLNSPLFLMVLMELFSGIFTKIPEIISILILTIIIGIYKLIFVLGYVSLYDLSKKKTYFGSLGISLIGVIIGIYFLFIMIQ